MQQKEEPLISNQAVFDRAWSEISDGWRPEFSTPGKDDSFIDFVKQSNTLDHLDQPEVFLLFLKLLAENKITGEHPKLGAIAKAGLAITTRKQIQANIAPESVSRKEKLLESFERMFLTEHLLNTLDTFVPARSFFWLGKIRQVMQDIADITVTEGWSDLTEKIEEKYPQSLTRESIEKAIGVALPSPDIDDGLGGGMLAGEIGEITITKSPHTDRVLQ